MKLPKEAKQHYQKILAERNPPTPLIPQFKISLPMDLTIEILRFLKDNGKSDTDLIIEALQKDDPQLTYKEIAKRIEELQQPESGLLRPLTLSATAEIFEKYLIGREIDYSISISVEISDKGRKHLLQVHNLQNPTPKNETNNYFGEVKGNVNTGTVGALSQTYSETGEKKSSRPKWLTLTFWWEETLKHWYKIILIALGAWLLSWKSCSIFHGEKDKALQRQEATKPILLIDKTTQTDSADRKKKNIVEKDISSH